MQVETGFETLTLPKQQGLDGVVAMARIHDLASKISMWRRDSSAVAP